MSDRRQRLVVVAGQLSAIGVLLFRLLGGVRRGPGICLLLLRPSPFNVSALIRVGAEHSSTAKA
jgi:hypothetical protein